MKLSHLLFLCAVMGSTEASAADGYSIIKQRAREVTATPPPPPVVRPAQPMTPVARPITVPPTNAPAAAALTAEDEAALKQLVADLNTIKPGSKPSAAQSGKIQTSLTALTDPAAAPPTGAINNLAGKLATAWASQKMTGTEQSRFAKDLRRVLHSPVLPAADAQSAVANAQGLLKRGGMDEDALQKLSEALNAIAATARP